MGSNRELLKLLESLKSLRKDGMPTFGEWLEAEGYGDLLRVTESRVYEYEPKYIFNRIWEVKQ